MEQLLDEGVQFHLAGGANPLVLVPTYVNDTGPHNFILDTGASLSLITPALASSLGIQPESEREGLGAGGAVKASLAHLDTIAVGSARQERIQVAITSELDRVGAAIRARVDGDLGFNFLKDVRVTLDYEHNILRLSLDPEERGRTHRSLTSVPFALAAPSRPLVLVQVVADGRGPFHFALDTGSSRTVLAPELAQLLGVRTMAGEVGTGGGGAVQMYPGKLSSLAIGDAAVQQHEIVVGDWMTMISAAAGTKLDGIVGYNFLNHFEVTIDYPRKRLELAPIS